MKKKFNKAKEGVKGFFRPRSRQSVLATPERSRGSSQEPVAAHDQEMPTAPPPIFSGNRQLIIPHANAAPGHNTLALKVPTPEPSSRPEDTSGVTVAYTHLPIEPSTSEIIGGVGAQVVDIPQDVKVLETQAQEVDEKEHNKAIATPQRSRGNSQEPAATHDQAISTAPPDILPASCESTVAQADATPSEDASALKVPSPEPSPQPEHTSGVAAADTQLHFEPSTHATIRSAETQVVETTQDVKGLATQRQEVDDKTLIKKHEKAIPTGQALLSLCSFGKIAYTLWPSQSGLPRRKASSITTATTPPLWAMVRS